MTIWMRIAYIAMTSAFIAITWYAIAVAKDKELLSQFANIQSIGLFASVFMLKKSMWFVFEYACIGAVKRGKLRRAISVFLLAVWRKKVWVGIGFALLSVSAWFGIYFNGNMLYYVSIAAAFFGSTIMRTAYKTLPSLLCGYMVEEWDVAYARWRHKHEWLKRLVLPMRKLRWRTIKMLESFREDHFADWKQLFNQVADGIIFILKWIAYRIAPPEH